MQRHTREREIGLCLAVERTALSALSDRCRNAPINALYTPLLSSFGLRCFPTVAAGSACVYITYVHMCRCGCTGRFIRDLRTPIVLAVMAIFWLAAAVAAKGQTGLSSTAGSGTRRVICFSSLGSACM